MSGSTHHRLRFVERIDPDRTIITSARLGKLYSSDGQKTLKSYHALDDVISRAKEFNQELPEEVEGMVVVEVKPGYYGIRGGVKVRKHMARIPVLKGTTKWLAFIDRNGDVWNVCSDHRKTSKIAQ
ncbi:MAG: hypothetical protein Q7T04_01565 [Dehalococcoidia bacterium]|nr:hypothetical protein [Dehalococcoidia bacterium]